MGLVSIYGKKNMKDLLKTLGLIYVIREFTFENIQKDSHQFETSTPLRIESSSHLTSSIDLE